MNSDNDTSPVSPVLGKFPLEIEETTIDDTNEDYELMPDFVAKQLTDDLPLYTESLDHSLLHRPFILDVSKYNGNYGANEKENSELALSFAIAQSVKEIIPEPDEVYITFMEALDRKDLAAANDIYFNCQDEAREVIDSELDEIPWRVSCEYYILNGKLQWLNSWIKIGWWNSEECELSPQFNKGTWLSDARDDPTAINTNCFESVVWSGKSKDVIHRLIRAGSKVNIEFEFLDGFLTPIDVAFTGVKSSKNILDLAEVEVGQLDAHHHHELDILRTLKQSVTLPNNTTIKKFRGCAIGAAFLPEQDPPFFNDEIIYDNVDDGDMDVQLLHEEDNDFSAEE
jgi:hypothetical protein